MLIPPKTHIVELTLIATPSDAYSPSNYPGPGAYLTPDHVIFVFGGVVNTVSRSNIPPGAIMPKPDPQPSGGVSEATLLRAIALVTKQVEVDNITL